MTGHTAIVRGTVVVEHDVDTQAARRKTVICIAGNGAIVVVAKGERSGKKGKGARGNIQLPLVVAKREDIVRRIRYALRDIGLRYLERPDQILNVVEVLFPNGRVADGAPGVGAEAAVEVRGRAGAIRAALASVADAGRRIRGRRAVAGLGCGRRRRRRRRRGIPGAERLEDVHGLRVALDLPEADGDLVHAKEEPDCAGDLEEERAHLGHDRERRVRHRHLVDQDLGHRLLLQQRDGLPRLRQRRRVVARRHDRLVLEPRHLPAPLGVLAQELAEPTAASAGAGRGEGGVGALLQPA
ncbi:hypothetical protein PG993_008036 [Apiospora rasikravindrae]|uniref:Uncharacterized protein n=1 Tax=Apiospora rasikravindrae TaxID=990691 RepID=A0ABR1SZ70_9PEZI